MKKFLLALYLTLLPAIAQAQMAYTSPVPNAAGDAACFATTLAQATDCKNMPTPVYYAVNTSAAATAGAIGQLISANVATAAAVGLTTASASQITSISLTAGDWDVWGTVCFVANGATTATVFNGAINTGIALPTAPALGGYFQEGLAVGAGGTEPCQAVGMVQQIVNTNTTVYLIGQSTFATNLMSAYGYIGARRRR